MKNMMFALMAFAAGCKDKAKDSADTKTSETKSDRKLESKEPSAPAGVCPDGFRYATNGGFCIKVPAIAKGDGGKGMEVGNGKFKQYGWSGGEKGSDFGLTVMVGPLSTEYWDQNVEDAMKKPPYQGKALTEGKIGDIGAWGSGEDGPPPAGYAQRRYINSIVKNEKDKLQLRCNVTRASGNGPPSEEEVFEACKTITFAKK